MEKQLIGMGLFFYFRSRFNMTDDEAYLEMVKHNQPGVREVKMYLERNKR